jgi:hypothetical protein
MTALGFKNLVGIVFLGVPDSIDLAYVLCPYPARFQKPSRYVAKVDAKFQWGWARFANAARGLQRLVGIVSKLKRICIWSDIYHVF